MVDYNDGTQCLIRLLFSITPDGHALFTGGMPMGASFSMRRLSYKSVAETAESMANALAAMDDASCVMIYSCIDRNLLLGMNGLDELREISDAICDKMPYHMSYSGGEFCPLKDDKGNLISHSHTYALVACVF
jgi:hypothetical protein